VDSAGLNRIADRKKEEPGMLAVKESAKKIIENLSDQSTWDDLMYELYVRQKIDQGLDDLEKGRVVSHEEVRRMMVRP
jgi:predicted transcriptional regulator